MQIKKIGILTFQRAYNYGAMLQAFALQQFLKKKNDVKIIDYYNNNVFGWYRILIRPFTKNPIRNILRFGKDLLFLNEHYKRNMHFENFINKNLDLSECCSENNINSIVKRFDILITGSDQVWNKNIVGELSDIYTLRFNKDSKIKKISYAASVGDVSLIEENQEEYKRKLSNLDEISVREEDAKEKLSKILDKKILVALDPTLLLRKENWESVIKDCTNLNNVNEKYIFSYVVEMNENYLKIVNELSRMTGLRVIHCDIKNPGYNNILKSGYCEGPFEFVNYIKNAEYVVTTSFHGTVFSTIFHKNFFVIPHKKTGARVTNLLNKVGINNRTFNTFEEFKNVNYKSIKTDWRQVDKNIEKERAKSIEWLSNAINNKSLEEK